MILTPVIIGLSLSKKGTPFTLPFLWEFLQVRISHSTSVALNQSEESHELAHVGPYIKKRKETKSSRETHLDVFGLIWKLRMGKSREANQLSDAWNRQR